VTQLSRRSLITGLISLVAAPAIVRAGSLMPVKVMEPEMNIDVLNWKLLARVANVTFYRGGHFWVSTPDGVIEYSSMLHYESTK
jgi:hypothetical protein